MEGREPIWKKVQRTKPEVQDNLIPTGNEADI